MKKGVHYDEVWAPVRVESLFMMISWAVATGKMLFYADVDCAFYGSKMDVPGLMGKITARIRP